MRPARHCTPPDLSTATGAASNTPLATPGPSPARPADSRSRTNAACRMCGRPALEDLVDAGGDVGIAHRACFVQWDVHQEALEQMLARSCGFPHHAADAADLELDPVLRSPNGGAPSSALAPCPSNSVARSTGADATMVARGPTAARQRPVRRCEVLAVLTAVVLLVGGGAWNTVQGASSTGGCGSTALRTVNVALCCRPVLCAAHARA
jgi:hypothetical protein